MSRTSSMAETNLDVIKRQKNAERKRYRLKRKMELVQQAPIDSETELEKKRKKAEYAKEYRLKRKLEMEQRAGKKRNPRHSFHLTVEASDHVYVLRQTYACHMDLPATKYNRYVKWYVKQIRATCIRLP